MDPVQMSEGLAGERQDRAGLVPLKEAVSQPRPLRSITLPLEVARRVLGLCYLTDDVTPSERASRLVLRIKVAETERR